MLSKSTLINRLLNRLLSSYDQCNQTNRSTSLPRADALSASSGPSVAGNRSNTNRILFAHLWTYILARCCIGGPFESIQHRHQTRPHHNHQYSSFSRRSHPLRCKVKKFLHRLSKSDLIRLWNVVDTNGSYVNDCILVHRTEQSSHYTLENNHKQRLRDQQRLSMCCNDIIDHEVCDDDDDEDDITPQWFIIMLRNWYRYDDIVQRMLKPLPWCSHYHTLEYDRNNQQSMYCINPYHWSLYNCDSNYDGGGSSRPRRQQHKASCKPSPPPIVISPILEDNVTPLDDDDCQLIGHKEMVQQCQQQHNQYYPMPSSTPPPSYSEANKQGQLFSDEAQCDGHMSPKSKYTKVLKSRWCRLSYWEYRKRVGDMFRVSTDLINIHSDCSPTDNGWTLPPMATACPNLSKIRSKIGLGVTIFHDESNCVWLYNRSSSDIFVNSITLNTLPSSGINGTKQSNHVVKVQPGHLIKAYDYQMALSIWSSQHSNDLELGSDGNGPSRVNLLNNGSFSFSFVKGFGNHYQRRDILECPCWLEVILDFVNK